MRKTPSFIKKRGILPQNSETHVWTVAMGRKSSCDNFAASLIRHIGKIPNLDKSKNDTIMVYVFTFWC